MKRLIRGRSTAAIIIAVVALVFALTGGAFAAKKLGLGSLSTGAKKKTVGVGKLTYVSVQQTYQSNTEPSDGETLTAACPPGTHALGGGVKLLSPAYGDSTNYFVAQQYVSTAGYTAKFFAGSASQPHTVQVTASCGVSQAVTGSPPSP